MIINRQNNEIIIQTKGSINMEAVQKVINYINAIEIVSLNQGTDQQAAELAREVEKT